MMAREQRQRFLLPTPVLQNLRRQFHKVPCHANAGERFNFHIAKQVMQQVSKLMEQRGDFAVREQRLLARDWRCEVAAH